MIQYAVNWSSPYYNKTLSVFENNGTGGFGEMKNYTIGNDTHYNIFLGDMDNDEDLDIVIGNIGAISVFWNRITDYRGEWVSELPINFNQAFIR